MPVPIQVQVPIQLQANKFNWHQPVDLAVFPVPPPPVRLCFPELAPQWWRGARGWGQRWWRCQKRCAHCVRRSSQHCSDISRRRSRRPSCTPAACGGGSRGRVGKRGGDGSLWWLGRGRAVGWGEAPPLAAVGTTIPLPAPLGRCTAAPGCSARACAESCAAAALPPARASAQPPPRSRGRSRRQGRAASPGEPPRLAASCRRSTALRGASGATTASNVPAAACACSSTLNHLLLRHGAVPFPAAPPALSPTPRAPPPLLPPTRQSAADLRALIVKEEHLKFDLMRFIATTRPGAVHFVLITSTQWPGPPHPI